MAKHLKSVIRDLIKPVANKRGMANALLLLDWEKIVPKPYGEVTRPKGITFATGSRKNGVLCLYTEPAWGPIVQMGTPYLIELINSYYGYKAVERLALISKPLKASLNPQKA